MPDREPRTVCELCRSRAESLHWVWAEIADEHRPLPQPRRRRGSLVGWLRPRRPAAPQAASSESQGPPGSESANGEALAPARSIDPAAPGARVGRAGAVREPGTRLERAVARFNDSEHSRTVAGLTRTLGPPSVSVGAAAGSPNEIRLTVAWELSWYQWGVDLGEPAMGVYEIDKGHEVSEIDAAAQQWNAHIAADGTLGLGAAPASVEGQPAAHDV
jgi:hypothetical protein